MISYFINNKLLLLIIIYLKYETFYLILLFCFNLKAQDNFDEYEFKLTKQVKK